MGSGGLRRDQLIINAPGSQFQVQQGTSHSSQTMDIQYVDIEKLQTLTDLIRSNLEQTGLGEQERIEVVRELDVLGEQVSSGSPKTAIVSKSLSFIKGVLEKSASSMIASGLLYEIGKFFH